MKKILALGVLFSVGTVFSVGYVAIPEGSATGTQAVAIGDNSVASGSFSVAAGEGAIASGDMAIAVGNTAVASGFSSQAIGESAKASGAMSAAFGYGAEASGNYSLAMGMNSEARENHSVAIGTNSIADRENTVSFGYAGGERQLTNIAAGTEATDAVNVSQLRLTEANFSAGLSETNRRIDSVKTDSDRGDALGAALAALNPIAYDPYEPTQIMAGLGNYKGHSAMAIGVAHYTNERTILHMGASSNGNDFMVNAGVTWKFGGAKKALPQQYQKGPISSVYTMQEEMTSIKSENQKLRQELELIKTQLGIQNNV